MPHERVGGVRVAHGVVPRQNLDVDRSIEVLVGREQTIEECELADHRTRQHNRRELVAVQLGVPGGDHAAHRVSDQDDRAVPGSHRGAPHVQRVKVGHNVIEVLDEHPVAAALAMAEMVGPVHAAPWATSAAATCS